MLVFEQSVFDCLMFTFYLLESNTLFKGLPFTVNFHSRPNPVAGDVYGVDRFVDRIKIKVQFLAKRH